MQTKKPSSKTSSTSSRKTRASRSQNRENGSALKEFFLEELKDIYWAEKHLIKALPKMQKAATSEDLASAFEDHLGVTQEHVSRLEQAFELLDEKPMAKKCEAMEGLVKEGEEIIDETDEGSATRDAALIIAAQKIEHYEIATYGGLVQLAKSIGRDDVSEILAETLGEEKEADEKLTSIAESSANQMASQEDSDDDEDEDKDDEDTDDEDEKRKSPGADQRR
jgi:ferritin-like metal-binding protein YciE